MIPKSGTGFRQRSCSNKTPQRDDDSKITSSRSEAFRLCGWHCHPGRCLSRSQVVPAVRTPRFSPGRPRRSPFLGSHGPCLDFKDRTKSGGPGLRQGLAYLLRNVSQRSGIRLKSHRGAPFAPVPPWETARPETKIRRRASLPSRPYCTTSPCSAKSRPSRSTSSLTRSPITKSTILRMIRVTITS